MKIVVILLYVILFAGTIAAQGKFAGAHKNIIGKRFTNEKSNPLLKGYQWRQGDVITDANDGRPQFLHLYFKGTDALLLYAMQVDGPQTLFAVIDVIEFKGITAGWDIRTAGCNEGDTEGQIIIALIKTGASKQVSVTKAWRCDRDKLRVDPLSVKNIKCIIEDGD